MLDQQEPLANPTATPDADQAKPDTQIGAQIRDFILERFPAFLGAPFTDETPLLDDGAIDSLGMIELINFLEETFGIEMDDDDFLPENLETPRALAELVRAKAA